MNSVTRRQFAVDVGYERFLGPEIFFHPEVWALFHNSHGYQCTVLFKIVLTLVMDWVNRLRIVVHALCFLIQFANPDFTTPISETVDTVIQNCPIDVRRGLYKVFCWCLIFLNFCYRSNIWTCVVYWITSMFSVAHIYCLLLFFAHYHTLWFSSFYTCRS